MFNLGPLELVIFLGFPFCGVIAAIYLAIALRDKQRASTDRR